MLIGRSSFCVPALQAQPTRSGRNDDRAGFVAGSHHDSAPGVSRRYKPEFVKRCNRFVAARATGCLATDNYVVVYGGAIK